LKPDADPSTCETSTPQSPHEPWKIYPPPPPPHWKWKSDNHPEADANNVYGDPSDGSHGFDKEAIEIPGRDVDDKDYEFEINEEGVYQVYAPSTVSVPPPQNGNGSSEHERQPLARIPTLKEYFTDLDFLLGVCSDGPAKSFAFRRLKYLASKWSLYCLLNEYQELADMKAVPHRFVLSPGPEN
jgi:AMP deaminase